MEIIKVHFGGSKPQDIDYRLQADGFAEVWVYKNISYDDEAEEYTADGIFLRTKLSEEEVKAQSNSYFNESNDDISDTEALAMEAYINSELALAMLEME